MTVPKRFFVVVTMIAALVVGGVVWAQMLRPTPQRPNRPNAEAPNLENVPTEINMQNPIPDCEKYMQAGLFKDRKSVV